MEILIWHSTIHTQASRFSIHIHMHTFVIPRYIYSYTYTNVSTRHADLNMHPSILGSLGLTNSARIAMS